MMSLHCRDVFIATLACNLLDLTLTLMRKEYEDQRER